MSDARLPSRASVALVLLTALLLAAAAISGYSSSEIDDSRALGNRAASALDTQDVRVVLADRMAGEVVQRVVPDALVVRPLVVSAVAKAVGTPPFRRLFARVVRDRHRALVEGERRFVFRLLAGGGVFLQTLREVSPRVAQAVPRGLTVPVIALDPRNFELTAVRVAGDVAGWWWPLLAGALLAAAACAYLAGSIRDALVQLGAAVAGAGLIVATIVAALGAFVVEHAAHAADLDDETERTALDALWSALFGDLQVAGLLAALGGAAVAALAAGQLTTERLGAVSDRFRDMARSGSAAARGTRAALLIALGLALILSPSVVVRAAAVAAGAVALLAGVAMLAGPALPPARAGARSAAGPLVLGAAVLVIAAVTAAGVALVLPSPNSPAGPAPAGRACNGSPTLCDRRLDEVAFPSTHNSYAAADERGWFFANQRHGIERQLRDGIRGFLIDVHYGVHDPESGRIRTDLAYEGSSRNKVARQLGPEAIETAERVAGRVGLGGLGGSRRPHLCHTLCELGSEPLDEQLEVFRRFLDAHPREVVVLFVEPYVPVEEIETALDGAGLLPYAAKLRRDRPLPTLGRLVRTGKRLIVLTEEDGGARPWYLEGFAFAQDTPLGATRASEFSCARFRGEEDSPLFLVNHWIDTFPPSPSRNQRVGGRVLRTRLGRCERRRGRLPNLVAVDFYERSDLLRIVERLNARR